MSQTATITSNKPNYLCFLHNSRFYGNVLDQQDQCSIVEGHSMLQQARWLQQPLQTPVSQQQALLSNQVVVENNSQAGVTPTPRFQPYQRPPLPPQYPYSNVQINNNNINNKPLEQSNNQLSLSQLLSSQPWNSSLDLANRIEANMLIDARINLLRTQTNLPSQQTSNASRNVRRGKQNQIKNVAKQTCPPQQTTPLSIGDEINRIRQNNLMLTQAELQRSLGSDTQIRIVEQPVSLNRETSVNVSVESCRSSTSSSETSQSATVQNKASEPKLLNVGEWIDDLDIAAQVYIAYKLIEPFEIFEMKFLELIRTKKYTVKPVQQSRIEPTNENNNSQINASSPTPSSVLKSVGTPGIKAKTLSKIIDSPSILSENNSRLANGNFVPGEAGSISVDTDLSSDNTITCYSTSGVSNTLGVFNSSLVAADKTMTGPLSEPSQQLLKPSVNPTDSQKTPKHHSKKKKDNNHKKDRSNKKEKRRKKFNEKKFGHLFNSDDKMNNELKKKEKSDKANTKSSKGTSVNGLEPSLKLTIRKEPGSDKMKVQESSLFLDKSPQPEVMRTNLLLDSKSKIDKNRDKHVIPISLSISKFKKALSGSSAVQKSVSPHTETSSLDKPSTSPPTTNDNKLPSNQCVVIHSDGVRLLNKSSDGKIESDERETMQSVSTGDGSHSKQFSKDQNDKMSKNGIKLSSVKPSNGTKQPVPPANIASILCEIDMFKDSAPIPKQVKRFKPSNRYYRKKYNIKPCFVRLRRLSESTLNKYLESYNLMTFDGASDPIIRENVKGSSEQQLDEINRGITQSLSPLANVATSPVEYPLSSSSNLKRRLSLDSESVISIKKERRWSCESQNQNENETNRSDNVIAEQLLKESESTMKDVGTSHIVTEQTEINNVTDNVSEFKVVEELMSPEHLTAANENHSPQPIGRLDSYHSLSSNYSVHLHRSKSFVPVSAQDNKSSYTSKIIQTIDSNLDSAPQSTKQLQSNSVVSIDDPRFKLQTYCGLDTDVWKLSLGHSLSSEHGKSVSDRGSAKTLVATQRFLREDISFKLPAFKDYLCYPCKKSYLDVNEWRGHFYCREQLKDTDKSIESTFRG